jgi:hypothetical protein
MFKVEAFFSDFEFESVRPLLRRFHARDVFISRVHFFREQENSMWFDVDEVDKLPKVVKLELFLMPGIAGHFIQELNNSARLNGCEAPTVYMFDVEQTVTCEQALFATY